MLQTRREIEPVNTNKLKLKTVLMASLIMAYEEAGEAIPDHIKRLALELQADLYDAEDAGLLEGSLADDFDELWDYIDDSEVVIAFA
jgi:hypothetical protein